MSAPAGGSGSAGLQARLPQFVTILAAGAVAAQLAMVVWKVVPGARRPPPPPPVALQAPASLDGLIGAHLFGNATQDPGAGADAPRTNVALVLAGTLAVRDPKSGLAIIGETAQAGHVYAVGSTLPGGVRLHEVYTDRVVLDRGGALETLPLPRTVASGHPARAVAGAEPPIGEAVQKLIAGGPEVVGDVLRPMPSYANGKLMGFRVYAGRDRRKFAKLGLQPGDVVTQINGVPLGDSQHGLDALRSLGNQATATVTVERAGTATQLTIDASQLNGMGETIPPAPAPAPAPSTAPAAPPSPNPNPNPALATPQANDSSPD